MDAKLTQTQQCWDEMATLDPMWAVLSDSDRQFGRWNPQEFFATGEKEVNHLMSVARQYGFSSGVAALDFGCGLGRLTRALKSHFAEVTGVDVSVGMLDQARQLSPDCAFIHNPRPDLSLFKSDSFDFIYSNLVLQHQQTADAALNYVREFHRVLRPNGMAVFQLPSRLGLRASLQLRRRLYELLRRFGIRPEVAYGHKLCPIRMIAVPEWKVQQQGFTIRHAIREVWAGGITSVVYFASK